MKRLLFLPLLVLPLLFLSCDAVSEPPSEPVTPQFDVTSKALTTNTVQAELRCANGVTGSVSVKVNSPGGTYTFPALSCTGTTKRQHTFGFNPGDADYYWLDNQTWSFGSCGSWGPSLYFTDIPTTRKCYVGLEEKGKTYLVIKVKYIK